MQDALRRFKADIFQALAHPTRIAILESLNGKELSAGTLIEKLGMEQANVSQHLAVLRAKQLVAHRKVGNQVFYSVRDPAHHEGPESDAAILSRPSEGSACHAG